MSKISKPSTPHRLSSASSVLTPTSPRIHFPVDAENLPLDAAFSSEVWTELSDSLSTLDTNMQNVTGIHESLSNFNESFASFLFGLQMNAWCVEFPERPGKENFSRREKLKALELQTQTAQNEIEMLLQEKTLQQDQDTTNHSDSSMFINRPELKTSRKSLLPRFAKRQPRPDGRVQKPRPPFR